jgi:hypothetical protein
MTTVESMIDAYEHAQIERLEQMIVGGKVFTPAVLYSSGPVDSSKGIYWKDEYMAIPADQRPKFSMQDDPRLPPMPAKPTLMDYFRYRIGPAEHLLQSARLAKINGCSEKMILACLLHDISMEGFIGGDHGYWGAQLIAPYVDEEVSWAVRYHQALRFFPDPEVGYEYPKAYHQYFGEDYVPDPYIKRDYEYARGHKWYMSARMITINDIYAFDPDVRVDLDDFADIIGRHFRQPEEGLGLDDSPSSHMWRTMMRPRKFL